ncbi:MAG: putative two-component sensor histidine kinase [Betaproteobacteria bacterium]|nr:putative two-component sensor histidine kinase [Betaproteobacteria bacterium]
MPRSLFARMVLVLFAGLIVAQLASFAVHWRERGEIMTRAMGMRSAARIADIIELLDSIEPAERAKIVSVFSSPPLRIALDVPRIEALGGDPEKEEQARQFTAALRRTLDSDFPVVVQATEARGSFGKGAEMRGGRRAGMEAGATPPPESGFGVRRFGAAFIVQAQLKDGTLVTFNARQPQETVAWPYQLLLSLGVLLAVVMIVTLIAVRWVTRPLNTLAAAAQSLGEDIHRAPIDERGPLEVSRAAQAFNAMQQKLVKFISDRTRIFAAMSHDLKTPITRLRLRAELLDDAELRAKFVKDLEEMEAMVSAALDFMRGVDTHEPPQPVDVMAMLESLQEDARETGGNVTLEGLAAAPYCGHAQTLKRCIGNLIDNALIYGQRAVIAVADSPAQLTISVRDAGPGIPEAELERVFEPFYRLDASRNRATGGTGLGLTIARNIARAHGGDVVLLNRSEGGLEAVLTLSRRT